MISYQERAPCSLFTSVHQRCSNEACGLVEGLLISHLHCLLKGRYRGSLGIRCLSGEPEVSCGESGPITGSYYEITCPLAHESLTSSKAPVSLLLQCLCCGSGVAHLLCAVTDSCGLCGPVHQLQGAGEKKEMLFRGYGWLSSACPWM